MSGHHRLQGQRGCLRDEVDAREHGGAQVHVVAQLGHHLQPREIEQRTGDRHDDHIAGDAEQIARTEHRFQPLPGVAADQDAVLSVRGLQPAVRAGARRRGLAAPHRPGSLHDQQQGGRAQRTRKQRCEPRPENRAQRAADGNQREQPPALFEREAIRHQRPEQHGGKHVEDTEPHIEHLPAGCADGLRRLHQQLVERGQAQCEEGVCHADKLAPREPADQPAEHRIDQQRHQRGAHEQPAHRLDAALHA